MVSEDADVPTGHARARSGVRSSQSDGRPRDAMHVHRQRCRELLDESEVLPGAASPSTIAPPKVRCNSVVQATDSARSILTGIMVLVIVVLCG
jgi:hypothetical protein